MGLTPTLATSYMLPVVATSTSSSDSTSLVARGRAVGVAVAGGAVRVDAVVEEEDLVALGEAGS